MMTNSPWVPLTIVKGGQAANFLVKAMESEWGRKLYAKTLIKNIGQAVYKVRRGAILAWVVSRQRLCSAVFVTAVFVMAVFVTQQSGCLTNSQTDAGRKISKRRGESCTRAEELPERQWSRQAADGVGLCFS